MVIMVIPPSAPILLTRNLLYTGITRAKKLLIVIGSEKIVDFMIKIKCFCVLFNKMCYYSYSSQTATNRSNVVATYCKLIVKSSYWRHYNDMEDSWNRKN